MMIFARKLLQSESKILFTIPNISVCQKDYAYLYANDKTPVLEFKKKKDILISLKKKIKKLASKKIKIDNELNYFEYKLLDSETF